MPKALRRSAGSVNVVVRSDEGGGGEQRAEDALQRAGRNEHVEALGDPAEGRRAGEAEQADDERPLAAEEVGDAPAE